ncbi:hypothetical protein [Streptomyces sp. TLI_171]|uniref:hypothetical protein n=1 Tax=Streptomyces sp. TLI_171 TaxID=1938859 RepID=UPI000C1A3F93|nr:hypothetical protein [Streptomyces sp. TLI_171]RKE19846.1 hypothetical protein BX266_3177 [Streptomyces sp. TLI_171]
MSTNRSRRIDRATAERLLGGVTVDPEAGQDPSAGQSSTPGQPELAALLAAAAATGTAGDGPLPGEEGAVAAFRQARRQPTPRQHRRRKMADTALARALSAKALAVALGVTAVGSVAVAAGTGRLPEVLGGPAPAPASAEASADHSPGPSAEPSASTGARTGTPSGGATRPGESTGRPGGQASATPGQLPDLAGLCRSFAVRVASGTKPREAAADPALAELAKEAGGPEKVTGYCTLLAAKAFEQQNGGDRNRPSPVPGQPTSPSASPSPSKSSGRADSQQSRTVGGSDQN